MSQNFSFSYIAPIFLLIGYFFIPIAPAPVHIAIFSCLLFGIFSEKIRKRYKALLKERVFLAFFIFFVILIFSCFYGPGSVELKLHYLGKYLEIGYMPLLAAAVLDDRFRDRSIQVFSFAMFITLFISYALFFGIEIFPFEFGWTPSGDQKNPTIFKLHITHSFFMAFAFFLWVQRGVIAQKFVLKAFYFFLAALACINILLMVEGRTGYVTLAAIISLLFLDKFSWKKLIFSVLFGITICIVVYEFIPKLENRVNLAIAEASVWKPNAGFESPIAARIDFWYNSIQIIKKSPWVGFGIAGFEVEYKSYTMNTAMISTVNPHNQYLLFSIQVGLIGLLFFLWLNYLLWNQSYRLDSFWGLWVRVVLVSFGVANIFNSMLLDFSEGIFFVTSLAIAFSKLLPNSECKK